MSASIDHVKTVIHSLINSRKGGSTIRQICQDYEQFEGNQLPFAKFGFGSATEFISSKFFRDILTIFSSSTGTRVYLKNIETKSSHIQKLVAETGQRRTKPANTRNAFPLATLDYQTQHLDEGYLAESIKENLLKFRQRIHRSFSSFESVFLSDDELPVKSVAKNTPDKDEYMRLFYQFRPAMLWADFTTANLGIKLNESKPVLISEIVNLSKIWINLISELPELIELMQSMQIFYEHEQMEHLLLSKSEMAPNQICSVRYNHQWYRAKILDAEIDDLVKVFLVDFGKCVSVEVDQVQKISHSFDRIAVKAICCSLLDSHLVSSDDEFLNEFTLSVVGRIFSCQFHGQNRQSGLFEVSFDELRTNNAIFDI